MTALNPLQGCEEAHSHPAHLKIDTPLSVLPPGILSLGATLERLDLSGTGLSALPRTFAASLPRLRIAFFSHCNFASFPAELASCAGLEMVAFRSNGMAHVPNDALPPRLRWLILTDNRLTSLPPAIGHCRRLEKCMLAGNRLAGLPAEMAACERLALLRLAANRLDRMPPWLWTMPRLAFFSFAGNPCVSSRPTPPLTTTSTVTAASRDPDAGGRRLLLPDVRWEDLVVKHTLGAGASGVISRALWRRPPPRGPEEVAVKLFRGALTSDGTPADEMTACLAAGSHDSLIGVLGRIRGHPDDGEATEEYFQWSGGRGEEEQEGGQEENEGARERKDKFQGGIVMRLIPPRYSVLGRPPTMETCTRDVFPGGKDGEHVAAGTAMSHGRALGILAGVAGALAHLHAGGIAHGDVYAHNILAEAGGPHALLGDLGAATVYGDGAGGPHGGAERLEVLAFAHLIEDVLGLMGREKAGSEMAARVGSGRDSREGGEGGGGEREDGEGSGGRVAAVVAQLRRLHARCSALPVETRPAFADIAKELQGLVR